MIQYTGFVYIYIFIRIFMIQLFHFLVPFYADYAKMKQLHVAINSPYMTNIMIFINNYSYFAGYLAGEGQK